MGVYYLTFDLRQKVSSLPLFNVKFKIYKISTMSFLIRFSELLKYKTRHVCLQNECLVISLIYFIFHRISIINIFVKN